MCTWRVNERLLVRQISVKSGVSTALYDKSIKLGTLILHITRWHNQVAASKPYSDLHRLEMMLVSFTDSYRYNSDLQIGLRVSVRDWGRARLSSLKTATFSELSFLPVTEQWKRILWERYWWDRSQSYTRDQELKSRARTQSCTRSPIWRLWISSNHFLMKFFLPVPRKTVNKVSATNSFDHDRTRDAWKWKNGA